MASVLLVEDEALIRMMVANMLEELGHTVSAEAANLARALALASSAEFDFAILDFSLGAETSVSVADALQVRNIPFAFASGYGSDGVPEKFLSRPRLRKPFQIDQLRTCITDLLNVP
ncbi:response regulator [Bradyrhizobium japonicum]|uniref:response regulator n=1 Tax=Bradyrhizobium japonicum TaxID=375 RepID=UPI000576278D|nr:response regulator [Bradyrhizobium japonicum]